MQKIKSFTDGYINLPVRQLDDGSIQFDAEQAAIGIGISQIAKSGNEVVRWERVNKYLSSPKVGMQISKGDFITESQFYELAIKANSKKAKKFQYWVTHDVLPSIRKNGVYMTDQTAYDITHDKDALGDLLLKAGSQLKQKDLVIQELKPKADYTDSMLANKGLETISMIAKNYGYSTREFNKLLHGLGIQYKQGKTWLLYAKYQDEGYTHVEPYEYTNSDGIKQVRNTMKWTQAGQKFLYDFLKSKGIMPLVEQPA
ncbi:Phage antirepressor [Lactiplantibacillus pentosus KCA1]|jgi:phage antirepressor YoqD-like protein|nr:phage repressor protein/antirepressor Ant [Lactiplantibacillus pentosus]EIW14279.1 Phage antirepressor [Lactiplantibacillus pentosus KCA1]